MNCIQFQKVSTLASNAIRVSRPALLYSWLFCAGRNLRVDGDHRLQKIVHNLVHVSYIFDLKSTQGAPYLRSSLLANLLDLLELLLGRLLCVLLGLLVAAGVLFRCQQLSTAPCFPRRSSLLDVGDIVVEVYAEVKLTSVSKVLNSDSFCDL